MTVFSALLVSGLWAAAQANPAEEEKKAAEAIQAFKAAYREAADSGDARIRAVQILAQVRHKKTAAALGSILVNLSEMGGVRTAAADALAAFRDLAGVSRPLMAAARQKDKTTEVRRAACRALGELRAVEALNLLHELLSDREADVAREAVVALGKIREKRSIPILIELLRSTEQTLPPAGETPGVGVVVNGNTGNRGGNRGGGRGGNGLGGAAGLALDSGVAGQDARREAEARRKLLQEPANQSLAAITGEKWTKSSEWSGWWSKNGSTFQVSK